MRFSVIQPDELPWKCDFQSFNRMTGCRTAVSKAQMPRVRAPSRHYKDSARSCPQISLETNDQETGARRAKLKLCSARASARLREVNYFVTNASRPMALLKVVTYRAPIPSEAHSAMSKAQSQKKTGPQQLAGKALIAANWKAPSSRGGRQNLKNCKIVSKNRKI